MIVNGASFATDKLTNRSGAVGTIAISDPAGGHALTIGGNNGSSTFAGLIGDAPGGPGSLEKSGTGTIGLINANTFTGGAAVSGGTLLVSNASGSATGPGGVTVANGGTLGGTGSAAGLTQVASGGSVAPGASAGTPTLDNVTFNTGSTLKIELGGVTPGSEHDQLVVNGTATLASTLDLSTIAAFSASPGQSFTVIAAGQLVGTFDNVVAHDGQTWTIDYDYNANTVTVAVCADDDGKRRSGAR